MGAIDQVWAHKRVAGNPAAASNGRALDIPTLLIVLAFFLVGLIGLGNPQTYMFDEGFYVPSAVRLARGMDVANREHPMLGKELIALSMMLFGASSTGWRMLPLLFGSIGIYAAAAAMRDWRAGRILAVLLAVSGTLFVLSRLAMLEVFLFAFVALGAWAFASRRFALAGIAFGLALGVKWTAVPAVLGFCAIFAIWRPLPLWRGVLALGVLPLAVYFLTFAPGFWVRDNPLTLDQLIPLQFAMKGYHDIPTVASRYASFWWQWLYGGGYIWMWEGKSPPLLAGNPVVYFALIPAVVFGLVKRWPAAFLWLLTLGFWAVTAKANLYAYHYLLPSAFGAACLANVLASKPKLGLAVLALAGACFAGMYPGLSGNGDLARVKAYWPVRPRSQQIPSEAEERTYERVQFCMKYPRACYSSAPDRSAADMSRSPGPTGSDRAATPRR